METLETRLPGAYLTRMQKQLGEGYAAYLAAMAQRPQRALRVNTCKISEENFRDLVDFSITPVHILDGLEVYSGIPEDITNIYMFNSTDLVKSSAHFKYITDSTENVSSVLVKSSGFHDDNTNPNARLQQKWGISCAFPGDITNSVCYRFPDDVAIGRHPLHAAGLVYVQEPSAQSPAQLLGAQPGMTVLDLCAAPGGKAGQLAQAMENAGLLLANDPVPSRAETLLYNLERLGVRNAVVTCMHPDALCGRLAGMCDAVLVDAPCSGEGMFRRDMCAVADWSVEHVHACAARQRAILDAADLALKDGGALVYSTCTFSPEENEGTVAAFLAAHPGYTLLCMGRLYPHTSGGEGQFMAKLIKGDSARRRPTATRSATRAGAQKARPIPEWEAFCADTLSARPPRRATLLADGRALLPPEGFDRLPDGLRVLRAGVLLGEVRQGRFLPAHALAMATPGEDFLRRVPLAGDVLRAYLGGETVPCDRALSGWCAATYEGFPLGFGKAVNGTLKNHLPKGLRIRAQTPSSPA